MPGGNEIRTTAGGNSSRVAGWLKICVWLAVAALSMSGCGGRKSAPEPSVSMLAVPTPPPLRGQRPYQINGTWYYPLPSAEGYEEEGLASWYGRDWHGRPTASGEPYNMYAMTAAHKILPLGTHVKVTHQVTGRSILVRINDRGPFVSGRIIDLSYEAAKALGMAGEGVAPVHVAAVQVASPQMVAGTTVWQVEPIRAYRAGPFTVQIGAFREPENAQRLQARMAPEYQPVRLTPFRHEGSLYYRVQIGRFGDLDRAQEALERLRERGFSDAFVVALEET